MAKYDNIPGCPGYYISKRGQIYSRVIPNGNDAGKLGKVWRERRVKIMIKTPTYSTKRVKIRNKSYSVSRLVALAYIPNPENKPCVCHKDNNPLNNHVDNLYWGTQAENMSQMRLDKRDYRKVSIRAHRRVIRLKSLGWSSSRIGKRFKVNRTCINRILNKYKALLK